ncbi:MAG: cytochrome c oxidase accessory protein CcoG [Saprospiraceae bacterium]|nr:cytochrome c oxidase accessory protein CcoG [Saprospiraceae bacterium]
MTEVKFSELSGSHRDKISTVDQRGKRIWIYVKKVSGKFFNYRQLVAYLLVAFLMVLPWLKYDGEPFVLFNILEGKFIIFGQHYTHQDFHLFVVGMLIAVVFIVLFTAIFGRLFCGWICPQTIFMEMVFRRIEWAIEGDANAQKRLDAAPWDFNKIWRKGLKHFIFVLISVIISHTFLSYIIGVDELGKLVTGNPFDHWQGLVGMVVFTAAFYGVFARLREQVCTTICPYGRLQGVMLDQNSLAVAYDFVRGEPRGKIRKEKPLEKKAEVTAAEVLNLPQKLGDCIDCKLCVHVCPTGIDIRNGTQLECVNCTACMDACDEVMVKIQRPKGLIRIDSYNGIIHKKKSIWNTRVAAYSVVLIALIGLESFLFASRNPIEALFLRTPGTLYQKLDDDMIGNLYNFQIVNKTADESHELFFKVIGPEGAVIEFVGQKPKLIKNGMSEGAAFIKIPNESIKSMKTPLRIEIYDGKEMLDDVSTNFFGPDK